MDSSRWEKSIPKNFKEVSDYCFKNIDPWIQTIPITPNRYLTFTQNDDVIFTHILKIPDSDEIYSELEQLPCLSGVERSWFSLLHDEQNHIVY